MEDFIMSKELRALLEEFDHNLHLETELVVRQAKELKSIQKAIAYVAEREWDNLSDEEKNEVETITKDTTSWWYTDVA